MPFNTTLIDAVVPKTAEIRQRMADLIAF